MQTTLIKHHLFIHNEIKPQFEGYLLIIKRMFGQVQKDFESF